MIAVPAALAVVARLAAASEMRPKDPDPLVPVVATVPDAVLEIRYAFDGNVFGGALYPFPAAYLRRSTALKLKKAADALRDEGFRLVIYDAYRPLSVQKKMWAAKPNRKFVADPSKGGSNHNRGAAVDVGLATGAGRRAPMPTEFDDFSHRAAHRARAAASEARRNLEVLRGAMEAAGFKPLPEEWWHYDDPAAAKQPALDVGFDELEKSL